MSCGLQYSAVRSQVKWSTVDTILISTSTVGFRFYTSTRSVYRSSDRTIHVGLGLERGFNFGAHFIGTYAIDSVFPF